MIDPKQFRDALGRFATGVTVITVNDGKDGITGLTANAFTSVSLDPPLVLACVDYRSSAYPALCRAGTFGIHILAGDQAPLALAFANKRAGRVDETAWRISPRGTPLLKDALVTLECGRADEHRGGDHAILVGRVLGICADRRGRAPLTFYQGRLNALMPASAATYSAASS